MKRNTIIMTSLMRIALVGLAFSALLSSPVRADIAAEWTFEVDEDLTVAPAGVTKGCSVLGTTTIDTGPTGIGTKWATFLQNGSMTANPGNNQGVTPIATATALFQHNDVEGTFYGVMSPNEDLTTFIFGVFGISSEGTDPGYVSSKISYGSWHSWAGRAPGPSNRANTAVYSVPWDTEEWYFLALYQIIKFLPKTTGAVLPVIFAGLVLIWPFLDNKPDKSKKTARIRFIVIAILMVILIALTVWGEVS